MADDRITTESVAVSAQETAPIVLRESETRRLVFKAMIVDKPAAPVRGCFVWQRKRAAEEWEDLTGETLTKLKAGEGYSLVLHSDEVATLLQGIQARKSIYEEHGIVFGQRDYFAETDLPEVVRKIPGEPDSELARALQALDPPELLNLGRSVTSRNSTRSWRSGMRARTRITMMSSSGRTCSRATPGCSPS